MVKITKKDGPGAKHLVAISQLSKFQSRVGWFESARYQDGTPVAAVAAKNEFGDPKDNVPARPFMRPTIKKQEQEWRDKAGIVLKKFARGDMTDPWMPIDLIGAKAAGDIRKTISLIKEPPLSPKTIETRKQRKARPNSGATSTKPLVDTKIMINSLTHTVEQKK